MKIYLAEVVTYVPGRMRVRITTKQRSELPLSVKVHLANLGIPDLATQGAYLPDTGLAYGASEVSCLLALERHQTEVALRATQVVAICQRLLSKGDCESI